MRNRRWAAALSFRGNCGRNCRGCCSCRFQLTLKFLSQTGLGYEYERTPSFLLLKKPIFSKFDQVTACGFIAYVVRCLMGFDCVPCVWILKGVIDERQLARIQRAVDSRCPANQLLGIMNLF